MTGTRAAELLGNGDTEKAHLGEALPQRLVIRRFALQHGAHRLRRRMLCKIAPRLIAQLLLVFREFKVHLV